jgi:hypothetical protein
VISKKMKKINTVFDSKTDISNNNINNSFISLINNSFELTGSIIYYPKFEWTTNYLIDQVFLCLIKTREKDNGVIRRYEKRARWFLRQINTWDLPPEFIIYRKDFSKRVYQEFVKLQRRSSKILDYIITSALESLFESIEETDEPIFNGNYYLLSKKHNLFRWRFDRKDDQGSDPDSKYELNCPLYNKEGNAIGLILDYNVNDTLKQKLEGVFN